MRNFCLIVFCLCFSFAGCAVRRETLEPVPPQELGLGYDELLFQPGERTKMLQALDKSLGYLQTKQAGRAYAKLEGYDRERVRRSVLRFKEIVINAVNEQDLWQKVKEEFVLYRAAGLSGAGDVRYTGYYQPVYSGSRVRTARYRYPLFRLPKRFSSWPKPHPARCELEGLNGDNPNPALRGYELVYLADRLDAFLVHVQGSARIVLEDGTTAGLQFAGATDNPYTSIGKELANDGVYQARDITIPTIRNFFAAHPELLANYICRNDRFIFFREGGEAEAIGCLGLPVTANRSIATDRSLMPPGALALIRAKLPFVSPEGRIKHRPVSRYVLDQDTGSAIRGPGRVDIFMGAGTEAGERAGRTNVIGELYYLLLRDDIGRQSIRDGRHGD